MHYKRVVQRWVSKTKWSWNWLKLKMISLTQTHSVPWGLLLFLRQKEHHFSYDHDPELNLKRKKEKRKNLVLVFIFPNSNTITRHSTHGQPVYSWSIITGSNSFSSSSFHSHCVHIVGVTPFKEKPAQLQKKIKILENWKFRIGLTMFSKT